MAATHVTDHIARAQRRLLSALRKPGTKAIVASWVRQDQRIVDCAHEVAGLLNIATGFGVILDAIGVLVGWGRYDLEDEDYRRGLRAKIRANRSHGRPLDLIEVVALYVAGNVEDRSWTVRQTPPAAIQVEGTSTGFDVVRLGALLRIAKPLGVRLDVVATILEFPDGEAAALFAWDGETYTAEYDEIHGTDWDLDEGTGGLLAFDFTV